MEILMILTIAAIGLLFRPLPEPKRVAVRIRRR